jgi:hypothetical protein
MITFYRIPEDHSTDLCTINLAASRSYAVLR